MARIVLPGDFVSSYTPDLNLKSPKLIGHGLKKQKDGVYATVPGILNESENKLWLTTSTRRYIPHAGDRVLGIITAKMGDYFRVDVGAPELALLNFMSFEGATKRNRPNVKVGDLIYGLVILSSKYLEPELSCIDAEGRARGLGAITSKGLLICVSLGHARRLLSVDNKFLLALGEEIKFETAIGMNGRIFISGGWAEVLAVREAILQAETSFESNYHLLVKMAVQKIQTMSASVASLEQTAEPSTSVHMDVS